MQALATENKIVDDGVTEVYQSTADSQLTEYTSRPSTMSEDFQEFSTTC